MGSVGSRKAGRPRATDKDEAILRAALDLLIEQGVEATSIEQVARRAGVTRPTVYRRFPDRSQMLVSAIHMVHVGQPALPQMPVCRSVEQMLSLWARALCQPQRRRLMRRLMTALHDHPALHEAYQGGSLKQRDEWIHAVLKDASDRGEFPPDADLEAVRQILAGSVAAHVATRPDTCTAAEIEAYLLGVLRQTCHRRGARVDADVSAPAPGTAGLPGANRDPPEPGGGV